MKIKNQIKTRSFKIKHKVLFGFWIRTFLSLNSWALIRTHRWSSTEAENLQLLCSRYSSLHLRPEPSEPNRNFAQTVSSGSDGVSPGGAGSRRSVRADSQRVSFWTEPGGIRSVRSWVRGQPARGERSVMMSRWLTDQHRPDTLSVSKISHGPLRWFW